MLFVNRLVHTLVPDSESEPVDTSCRTNAGFAAGLICIGLNITLCPVSYTHLTLPTNSLV